MSHAARAAARTVAPAGLAVAAFLVLTLSGTVGPALLGLAVAGLAVAATVAAHRRPVLGTDLPARLLLAAGVLGNVIGRGAGSGAVVVAGVLLLGGLLAEPLLYRLARPWFTATGSTGAGSTGAGSTGAGLPAQPGVAARTVENGVAWSVNSAAVLATGLVAVLAGPGWLLPLPALGAAAYGTWLLIDGARRWRTSHRSELAPLTRALEAHRPRFLLYFSAPPGSAYQATMWLPYLDRLGEPYLVLLAERHNLAPVRAATSAPVVVCDTFEAIDAVMVPSLRAAFYVNNGMKNAHCVRYTHLTHVQLYHGDSDKTVTASPLNALFDRVFVAGQAAIDRFAVHSVEINQDRFRIVGRPQVERLAVASQPISEVSEKMVLYAPTWVGAHADSHYCSLPIAEATVGGLLARGVTVIFRPHPYAARDRRSALLLRQVERQLAADQVRSGRAHRWGRDTSVVMSLFDCMNESHAMVCDVSAVASDYLYTGKPFALTDMSVSGAGADSFTASYPLARAAYVLRYDSANHGVSNLEPVLDDLLVADPMATVRREVRTYYLGDIPPERYAEAFLTEARRTLDRA